jgi:hypothetical protein
MLRYAFGFVVAVALVLLAGSVAPADEQSTSADLAAYYAACIDRMIDKCTHKQSLRTCSSPNLRAYADRMVQKRAFCQAHRDHLIRSMLARQIEPKTYQVEHFINQHFYRSLETTLR